MVNWEGDKEGLFTIGVVSQMLEINPQTLRIYERRGLIDPSRSKGNTRLYSRIDVERVRLIVTLTRELDVNLAGVEVIMNLLERIHSMEKEYGNTVKKIIKRIMGEFDLHTKPEEGALIPLRSKSTKLSITREYKRR
ncbi:MerR family transcriptional regulator [bacterium]|nr:MerR family transcriptional regulator [bacterium]